MELAQRNKNKYCINIKDNVFFFVYWSALKIIYTVQKYDPVQFIFLMYSTVLRATYCSYYDDSTETTCCFPHLSVLQTPFACHQLPVYHIRLEQLIHSHVYQASSTFEWKIKRR